MEMRKSKVYTRAGDAGDTGIIGGGRLSKAHPRIAAYGSVDELNAQIGLARHAATDLGETGELLAEQLAYLQNQLFGLGTTLATPSAERGKDLPGVGPDDVEWIEQLIDAYSRDLPPLKQFVLPAGSALIAGLHVVRTVARRAERAVIALHEQEALGTAEIVYLNRLSDLFFVLARWACVIEQRAEVPWRLDLPRPRLP